jgi:acylphosphatase
VRLDGGDLEGAARLMLVARRYRIAGRVQRVGFRWFVQDAAVREGLSGYVRNLPDGSVEVVAEGDADVLARFERDLRRGPPGARVETIETTEEVPDGRQLGFVIRM